MTETHEPDSRETRARPEIVVGVDGSEPSKCALRWAAHYARETGRPLHAVTAWEPPIMFAGELPAGLEEDFGADALAMLEATIDETLGAAPEVKIRTSAIEGHPVAVLVREARAADILAIGHRGHSPVVELMLGSVSLHCVSRAPCPVVVARESSE